MCRIATLVIVASIFLTVSALSQEKKIMRSQLPPAVQKTVDAESQGATVRGFSVEKEKGSTFYEAELAVNGRSKDVLIDSQGNVVEIEEEVEPESLPPAVRNGLQAKAGKGKLVKVESVTRHGKLVAYEAQVSTDGKRSEVKVGPDGKSQVSSD
jgi:hypothetical protein